MKSTLGYSEVVTDLVHHGDPHLLHYLLPGSALPLNGFTKDGDPVG